VPFFVDSPVPGDYDTDAFQDNIGQTYAVPGLGTLGSLHIQTSDEFDNGTETGIFTIEVLDAANAVVASKTYNVNVTDSGD
jgi:hypothetical protein